MIEFIFTNFIMVIVVTIVILTIYLILGNYISKKHCNYLKNLMGQNIYTNNGDPIKFPIKFIRLFIIVAWPLWYMIYATLTIIDSCIVPILIPVWAVSVFSMFFIITAPLACILVIIMGSAGWVILELHWLFGVYPNFGVSGVPKQEDIDKRKDWENKLRFPKH